MNTAARIGQRLVIVAIPLTFLSQQFTFRRQVPVERRLLEWEHARGGPADVVRSAIGSGDARLQRIAARAVGRLEDSSLAPMLEPLLHASDASVRMEAVNAFGQMHRAAGLDSLIAAERSADVRGALFETIGRAVTVSPRVEQVLANGLRDTSPVARTGAARGLEAYVRRTARTSKPQASTVTALRRAVIENGDATLRQLAVLALTAAADRDSATFAIALRDTSAQVRRVAVMGSRTWINDPAPMVRYAALRVAGNCERALALVNDTSEHVALAAIDVLGERSCRPTPLENIADRGRTWRMRAHALVSLARVSPDAARRRLASASPATAWHARVYAANAAQLLHDSVTLARLVRDTNPNVAIAALTTEEDALRALASNHSGLVFAAATKLKGNRNNAAHAGQVVQALERITNLDEAWRRDARIALLELLGEIRAPSSTALLSRLRTDRDPVVAAKAGAILTSMNVPASAGTITERYRPAPLPSDAAIRSLAGATAVIRMRDAGTITLALLTDDAPVTCAIFAELAESGRYNGLTMHRIVPNFVIQGGSPGADEYDGLTRTFMRDELGFARNARGTFGISTRGRDTGDGQIYVNLVDNFRLDHDYTVFARTISGLDAVDRVQEGDVIQSVTIRRRR